MKVGDLVTVWTDGWAKPHRDKYANRAGVIVRLGPDSQSYKMIWVDFGEGPIEVGESRIRPLVEENTKKKECPNAPCYCGACDGSLKE